MTRKLPILTIPLLLTLAIPIAAIGQQDASLGITARKLRAEKRAESKPNLVFTNDNLPSPKANEAISTLSIPPEITSTPAKAATTEEKSTPKEESASKPAESTEDKVKTQDYWQSRFRAARQDVAKAKEHEQLAEDELNLLQIRQVRELDPMAKDDLSTQAQAKQSEVDINRAATEAAQKTLDDLSRLFEASGAPEDWSKTD